MSTEEAAGLPPVPSVEYLLQVAHGYAQRAAEQAELIGATRVHGGYPEPRSLGDPAHTRLDAAARLSAFTRVADTFALLAQTVALADAGDPAVSIMASDRLRLSDRARRTMAGQPEPHDPECESELVDGAGYTPCQCGRRATRARLPRLAPGTCHACRERDRGNPPVANYAQCTCPLECGAVRCAGQPAPPGSALEHYLAEGRWPDGMKTRPVKDSPQA